MNIAEQRFCWLLKQRGYKFWTEDQLAQKIKIVTTRPDFFVETKNGNILVEIEAIEKPGPKERQKNIIGTVAVEELLGRLKGPIKKAAKQLSPYKNLGMPCMVILDNWRQIRIRTNIDYLTQIFGVFEFRALFDSQNGSLVGPLKLYHGNDQRLRRDKCTYISAVAVNIAKERYLDDDMKSERPMRLKIVHNPFALNPIPMNIFRDKGDEHWYYQEDRWLKS